MTRPPSPPDPSTLKQPASRGVNSRIHVQHLRILQEDFIQPKALCPDPSWCWCGIPLRLKHKTRCQLPTVFAPGHVTAGLSFSIRLAGLLRSYLTVHMRIHVRHRFHFVIRKIALRMRSSRERVGTGRIRMDFGNIRGCFALHSVRSCTCLPTCNMLLLPLYWNCFLNWKVKSKRIHFACSTG